jgi:SAM-dependent methyltransferase
MIAAAQARGADARVGSAESLPFASRSFDAVFSNAVLHWVRDQDAMMAEVHRVLKPGGRFVAEMGGHGNVAAISVALCAVLVRHGHAESYQENYYPTPDAYTHRLLRHGFQVERAELIPRPTPLPESGMEGWIRTFRRDILNTLPDTMHTKIVEEAAALLAPSLRDEDGKWIADYIRLRFIAKV